MCWSESSCSGAGLRIDMARMTVKMDGDYQIMMMRMPSVLKCCTPLLHSVCRKQTYFPMSPRAYQPVIWDAPLKPVAVVGAYDSKERNPSSVIRIRSMVVPKNSDKPKKRVSITRFLSFMRAKCCACRRMLRNCSLINLGKVTLRLTEGA